MVKGNREHRVFGMFTRASTWQQGRQNQEEQASAIIAPATAARVILFSAFLSLNSTM